MAIPEGGAELGGGCVCVALSWLRFAVRVSACPMYMGVHGCGLRGSAQPSAARTGCVVAVVQCCPAGSALHLCCRRRGHHSVLQHRSWLAKRQPSSAGPVGTNARTVIFLVRS